MLLGKVEFDRKLQFVSLFHWPTRTEHYPDAERISKEYNMHEFFHASTHHGACCTQHDNRWEYKGESYSWSITRTDGVGLCQRAAGGPLLWYAFAGLVSWKMRRPERTRTRTRACTALLEELDSMTARVTFHFHHTAVAAAAAAATAVKRSAPALWRA